MTSWRSLCAVSVVALLGVSSAFPVTAQQQTRQPSAGENAAPEPARPSIPAALVEQLLSGAPGAAAAVHEFLVGPGTRRPEEVAQRATALISQIGEQRAGVGTDALLRVIDRVASAAINMVAGSQIVRIGIDRDFVPRSAVVALDFGPPDQAAAPGFERVPPGDPRIGGAEMAGLRRPADNNFLQDGITGVERIEVDLPDGDYRIILMTQNLGDSQLMSNPFGSEVVVNGGALQIGQPSPDRWVEDAVLSNRGVQSVSSSGNNAGQGAPGFIAGDLTGHDPETFRRQQGGAIIVTAQVRGGKLIIELKGFQNARSYLTGLMVEPASRTSDLILSREAVEALVPTELRLALEEDILASAAGVLAGLDPADGDPELVDLPEPILDPEENASASS